MSEASKTAQAAMGAQWLLESAAAGGIEVCFANPGTTELPFVAAMDRATAIRPILGLFEGVCSGAADGYYRIRRKPAMTLTHLGPGFANAIANFHNARRARSAILNIIGEHMSWHVAADPPLASDIESLARPVSAAVRRADSRDGLRSAVAQTLDQLAADGGIQTLILPMDLQEEPVTFPVHRTAAVPATEVHDAAAADRVAAAIRHGRKVLLYLGQGALTEDCLTLLRPLEALPNVEFVGETFPAVCEYGRGLPLVRRLPALAAKAHAYLLGFDCVALLDVSAPVAFFGTRDVPSFLGDPTRLVSVCGLGRCAPDAIRHLVEAAGVPKAPSYVEAACLTDDGMGSPLTADSAARVVATHLPAHAIVSAEGATLGFPFNAYAAHAERHTTIVLTGGAIGQGLPSAFGASIADPGRKVVALQSDGSAMFTVQSLWSMAREGCDVVVVLASNRRYGILINEMSRNGYDLVSEPVRDLLSLERPSIDWLALSKSFGVPACRVETVGELRKAFTTAVAEQGPRLIEAVLA
ncbi:MAG: acetolactate synthase large subunit [Burkholderiaceae bacterium]